MNKEALIQGPVKIIDSTFREGQQRGGKPFNTNEKIAIMKALIGCGVENFEVFGPNVSHQEKYDVEALIKTRDQMAERGYTRANILVHLRCNMADVEQALEVPGIDGFNFYIGTSEESRQNNHGITVEEVVKIARKVMEFSKERNSFLKMRFSAEHAFETDPLVLEKVFRALSLADRFGIPDTRGRATGRIVEERVKNLLSLDLQKDFETHFHHDFGRSWSNAVIAVLAGARYINTSVLGLGERNGITDMASLLVLLDEENSELVSNYNLHLLLSVNELVSEATGISIVGRSLVHGDCLAQAAGVHSRAPQVYENEIFKKYGVKSKTLLTPYSGWHAISDFMRQLGVSNPTKEVAIEARNIFKERIYTAFDRGIEPIQILEKILQEMGLIKSNGKTEPTVVFSSS